MTADHPGRPPTVDRPPTSPGGRSEAPTGRRDSRSEASPGGRSEAASGRGGDRGGATVCVLAAGLVLVVCGTFGAAVATAAMARQRAGIAADFAALAGAATVAQGPEVACLRASALAEANGGRLADCRVDGLDVQVTAEVTVTALPGLTRTVTTTARAGPVRA